MLAACVEVGCDETCLRPLETPLKPGKNIIIRIYVTILPHAAFAASLVFSLSATKQTKGNIDVSDSTDIDAKCR